MNSAIKDRARSLISPLASALANTHVESEKIEDFRVFLLELGAKRVVKDLP